MTTNQTTTGALDTAELELASTSEAPAAEPERDEPIWTPEDGDFN